MSSPNFKKIFIDDISRLLKSGRYSNVEIRAGEAPNVKVFRAHSVILRARCPYFRTALSPAWNTESGDKFKIEKPNIKGTVFEAILRYIYTGKCILQNCDVVDLLLAADEILLVEIVTRCQDKILKDYPLFFEQDLVRLYEISSQLNSCTELNEFCSKRMAENAASLFKSVEFLNLNENLLVSFLKRDDLASPEVEIWEFLVKWALAQNPNIPEQVEAWSEQDISDMQNTVENFLPLIKFLEIPGKDYLAKVRPYKKLLPDDLRSNIKKYHITTKSKDYRSLRTTELLPDTQIGYKYLFDTISTWILRGDKPDYSNGNQLAIRYNFKLLLRGSRDGFSRQVFGRKCANEGNLVVLIRTKNPTRIIGGYNPRFWEEENGWRETKHSFIFRFSDVPFQEVPHISRVKNEKYAINLTKWEYNFFNDIGFGRGDLYIFKGTCQLRSYESEIFEEETFKMDDYEVFQVELFFE
ncbi:4288_t:CDS:2 [Ambispora leptoticha]|uniref:4288_t:CDS:1 n=1 Tax=Ambispora leptoticha TaxID=144679 RepID=A0A9N9GZI7_9GLOM|nr:4288_t:CDS:2 [Ambispora leptoticha]